MRAATSAAQRASLLVPLLITACVQSTGGRLVQFTLEASGDPAVVSGAPLTFTTSSGFEVTLTRARLHVGAIYFNVQNPQNYALESSCIQPGLYSGEVRGGLTIDTLNPVPEPFPIRGNGTDTMTRAAELWLGSGDINAENDGTVVLDVAGEAVRGVERWPFEGRLTIGKNRFTPPRNPALPGSNPLCQQRIVSPIPVEARLSENARVWLKVDPIAWFSSVDFSQLQADALDPSKRVFVDSATLGGQPDVALFNGLTSASGPYAFEIETPE
jgi:hypothetical protein